MNESQPTQGLRELAPGFGVYQIPPEQTQQAVENALAAGYRHIDTAAAYGNESEVGAALAATGLPRDELFVTTKLWIQDATGAEASTVRAGEESLKRLGLETVDLYLMHQPYGDVYAQWRGMERLQESGLARHIGVSNFTPSRVVDLGINNAVMPAVNQIEVNPFHQNTAAVEALQSRGVLVEAWAPFAEGRSGLFQHPVLTAIAERADATVAQVVLAWLAQRGIISLAKSIRPERMAENFASRGLLLEPQDLEDIARLDEGSSQFFDHEDPDVTAGMAVRRLA